MEPNKDLIFSDRLIEEIPFDVIDGVIFISQAYIRNLDKIKNSPNAIDELISAHAIMHNYLKNNDEDAGSEPQFSLDKNKLISEVDGYIRGKYNIYSAKQRERLAKARFENIAAKVGARFGNYIIYELSESQINNIQNLINELRNKIGECEVLEDSHKQRLLNKLEKLQAELHKKMTDFDRFYGLFVEANFLYQNFKETKPIFELTIKLANIVLESMALANGLPVATLSQLPF